MSTELWSHSAQLWPTVVESAYRRERIAADFASTRGARRARASAAAGRIGLRRRSAIWRNRGVVYGGW